jgi:hypothetical protein
MVYNVDSNGLVIAATNRVNNKFMELRKAQEELTLIKLMAYISKMQVLPTSSSITKARSKGKNYVTLQRKNDILKVWRNFNSMHEVPSICGVKQMLNTVKSNEGFEWCGNLSQRSITSIYKFIQINA